jgi:sulfur-oxidizing protein SoxY
MGMRRLLLAALAAATATPALAAEADPLASGMWEDVRRELFGDAPAVFDERVRVLAPANAEDAMNVPVTVDARALPDVREIVVLADANPIREVARLEPVRAEPYLGLRLKLQQGSPVRAAARTGDGVWHVGGVFVDAAGGGCTAPAPVRAADDWVARLGEMNARAWPEPDGAQRVRFRVYHPMDTGLAPGIAAFFVERVEVRDEGGGVLARLLPAEPVSQHPTVTLLLRPEPGTRRLTVDGRDNDGNVIRGAVPLAWPTQ